MSSSIRLQQLASCEPMHRARPQQRAGPPRCCAEAPGAPPSARAPAGAFRPVWNGSHTSGPGTHLRGLEHLGA
eukprot:14625602-Alexandrium_andersonii.AAC.1